MATMVDVGLIEVNSYTLKRIEDNNEAAKRGADCERWNFYAAALYPIKMYCVPYYTLLRYLLLRLNKRALYKALIYVD